MKTNQTLACQLRARALMALAAPRRSCDGTLPSPPSQSYYWQIPRQPPNSTRDGVPPCRGLQQTAFGRDTCPNPPRHCDRCLRCRTPATPRDGGLLFFSARLGLLTNCLMVLNLARWLAEQFGKTVVLPLCTSSENPEHTCVLRKNAPNQRLRYVMVNMSALYTSESLGGCVQPRPAVALRDVAAKHTRGATQLTCISSRAEHCAADVARDPQLQGIVLSRFVRSDALQYALAWLNGRPRDAPPRSSSWAAAGAVGANARACVDEGHRSECPSRPGLNRCMPIECPQRCGEARPALHIAGDIFVPNLFLEATLRLQRPFGICNPPVLQPRARVEAMQMQSNAPFVCVHWRAGDFLVNRAQQASSHLFNGSTMVAITASAASAAGASHALVLTNARVERQAEMRAAARAAGLKLRVRACTAAPPDVEKHACAERGRALVLSAHSTFSEHMLSLAPAGTPYVFVGGCDPSSTSVDACLRSPWLRKRGAPQQETCRIGRARGKCGEVWLKPPQI